METKLLGLQKPYIVEIENISDEAHTAILFGCEENSEKVNFGSPSAIQIRMGYANVSYEQMLHQSKVRPFQIELFGFYSLNDEQLRQMVYFICRKYASGLPGDRPAGSYRQTTDPVDLASLPKIELPFQNISKHEVFAAYPTNIDEYCLLEIIVLPKTKLIIRMYPKIEEQK